jgi:hypothetical protein
LRAAGLLDPVDLAFDALDLQGDDDPDTPDLESDDESA